MRVSPSLGISGDLAFKAYVGAFEIAAPHLLSASSKQFGADFFLCLRVPCSQQTRLAARKILKFSASVLFAADALLEATYSSINI
jgi:hypothetical protein